jgi:hypothetical protein
MHPYHWFSEFLASCLCRVTSDTPSCERWSTHRHPRSRTCTGSPMATSATRSSGSFVLPLLSVVDRALSSARSAAPSSLAALRSTLLADWLTEAAGIMRSGRMLHSCKARTTIVAASALHAHEEGAVDITLWKGGEACAASPCKKPAQDGLIREVLAIRVECDRVNGLGDLRKGQSTQWTPTLALSILPVPSTPATHLARVD